MNNNDLTKEQRYDIMAKKNRDRQKAYYDRNTELILAKKKAQRKGKQNIPVEEEPANEVVEEEVIQPAKRRSNRKNNEPAPEPVELPPARKTNKRPVLTIDGIEELLKANQSTFITYRTDVRRIAKIIKGETDFVKIINNPKKTIPAIEGAKQENGTDYGTSSKKGCFQVIMKLIDEYKIPASENTRKQYLNKFQIYDYNVRNEEKDKTGDLDFAIPTATEYLQKVKEKYTEQSKQYALVSLYTLNAPVRDNFGSLILSTVKKTTAEDKDNNYIYIPPNKKQPLEVIINKHKTSQGKGSLKSVLSTELSNILRDYIIKNNINPNGGKMFSDAGAKLSGYISGITSKIFPTIPKGNRGTKLFRNMAVSKSIANDTIEQRQELANKMGSSLRLQTEVYNRPVLVGKKKTKK